VALRCSGDAASVMLPPHPASQKDRASPVRRTADAAHLAWVVGMMQGGGLKMRNPFLLYVPRCHSNPQRMKIGPLTMIASKKIAVVAVQREVCACVFLAERMMSVTLKALGMKAPAVCRKAPPLVRTSRLVAGAVRS
jgi:hypothetical protein